MVSAITEGSLKSKAEKSHKTFAPEGPTVKLLKELSYFSKRKTLSPISKKFDLLIIGDCAFPKKNGKRKKVKKLKVRDFFIFN